MSDEEDEALCYDEPADQLATPNHRGDNDDAELHKKENATALKGEENVKIIPTKGGR